MEIQPFNRAHVATNWWRPPNFRWHYATYALVGIGIVVSIGILLLPKESQNSRVDDAIAAAAARKAKIAEIIANPGEVIYIEPGMNPFPTKPPANE